MSKSGYSSPNLHPPSFPYDTYVHKSSYTSSPTHFANTTALIRVSVSPECITKFNDLKLGKSIKYIIYKLSDDYKEIVVEDSSSDHDWESFQNKLMNAKSSHRNKEGKGPRYAVYDFQYDLEGGEGTRNKIVFISWSPDDGMVFPKMTYASSKESFKNALSGIASEVQANRDDEIEYETILKDISKGKR